MMSFCANYTSDLISAKMEQAGIDTSQIEIRASHYFRQRFYAEIVITTHDYFTLDSLCRRMFIMCDDSVMTRMHHNIFPEIFYYKD